MNVCIKYKNARIDGIDISEGIYTNETSASKECNIFYIYIYKVI